MKVLSLVLFLAGPLLALSLFASTSPDLPEMEPQVASGISLPFWEEGEAYESFDVRIWPEAVIQWLEEENLRDLIADPGTPTAERDELKRILAMQRAWRNS